MCRAEFRMAAGIRSTCMHQPAKHDSDNGENSEPGSNGTQAVHDLLLQFDRQTIASPRLGEHPMFMGTQAGKCISSSRQLRLPGRKHRIEIPSELLTGHTMVRPARLGSVMTASSGTTIHSPSRRTR